MTVNHNWNQHIGKTLRYLDQNYQVIDVIESPLSLVIQAIDEQDIQTNQFGEARRRVNTTQTIKVTMSNGNKINPVLNQLLVNN